MIRLGRKALLLAAFSLLTSAATAHAECAWVLWQHDGTLWTTLAAWPQQEECARRRVEHYGLAKAPLPGVGTLVKSKQGAFFMRYDTVDPRRSTGK